MATSMDYGTLQQVTYNIDNEYGIWMVATYMWLPYHGYIVDNLVSGFWQLGLVTITLVYSEQNGIRVMAT